MPFSPDPDTWAAFAALGTPVLDYGPGDPVLARTPGWLRRAGR
ncbi:succinyl-diaminopimelate desuccinylase [Streptomyces olivochromogenes]|nr:succinyl-diaminopimelate desuccinylase [Streptomyces olivochromogenes]